jgi:hypothetical protein
MLEGIGLFIALVAIFAAGYGVGYANSGNKPERVKLVKFIKLWLDIESREKMTPAFVNVNEIRMFIPSRENISEGITRAILHDGSVGEIHVSFAKFWESQQ